MHFRFHDQFVFQRLLLGLTTDHATLQNTLDRTISALEFIRQNADKAIKVSDVVQHLGVSRRLADLRFREIQGESILETITRCRLAEIEKRLLTTNLSIRKIARNCGFSSVSYLETLFTRRYGETLHRYRQSHQSFR